MRKNLTSLIIGIAILGLCKIGIAADASFVASKGSDRYHVPTCGIAQKIKPENLVRFGSESEAAKAGYSPCKVCIKKDASQAAFIGSK